MITDFFLKCNLFVFLSITNHLIPIDTTKVMYQTGVNVGMRSMHIASMDACKDIRNQR